jgi:DNA polymerase V
MSSGNAIALIDCNNFFVSCERAVNPELNSRPVVVLSNNDGCIISRSEEVKQLGVAMGAPLFQVRELLEKHNTAIISSNHALYREYAERVLDVMIEDLGKGIVEMYSIDEAFIDVGTPDKLDMLGKHIKKKILEKTKIPVSVGFAETKTLAKLANDIAKKSRKVQGVLSLYNSPYTDTALKRSNIEDIWGIGRRFGSRLKLYGINTAYDLKKTDPDFVRDCLNVFAARTILELNGIKCIPIEATQKDNKSISHTRTFGTAVRSFSEIKNAVLFFAARALEKMRWNNLMARVVTVFLTTDRFRPIPNYYAKAATYNSVYYSDITGEIFEWVLYCLNRIFVPEVEYRRAGVVLSELLPAERIPERLLEPTQFERLHRLNRVIDELNLRYGRDVIRPASLSSDGAWQSMSTHRINDVNHIVERDRLGLGKTFSRPLRFL